MCTIEIQINTKFIRISLFTARKCATYVNFCVSHISMYDIRMFQVLANNANSISNEKKKRKSHDWHNKTISCSERCVKSAKRQ